ncbi:MAG: AAA family ATPase [Thalassovita sp.]|nr:AAA family ATPase [Thalassovita sp.]
MAVLVTFAGLPGTGKSTIARHLSARLPAAWLRIDAIEQCLRDIQPDRHDMQTHGYHIAAAVAEGNLAAGHNVIADSVNPSPLTREIWSAIAEVADARELRVELICSDPVKHRHRVENRRPDITGLKLPDWSGVLNREYQPWTEADLHIDTAELSPDQAVEEIMAALG